MPASRAWDAILIVGSGGSGSKRLLRLFDQSERTHCRNEPYNHRGSPFAPLREAPRAWWPDAEDEALFERSWDAATEWTARRLGYRDALPPPPKRHLARDPFRAALLRLLASRRARRGMGHGIPALREDEWRVTRWIGDPARLADAQLVMKFNQAPGLVRWVLGRRPRVKVLHLVRHPAGYAHSWSRRVATRFAPPTLLAANRERLRAIAARSPEWERRLGPIGDADALDLELRFWAFDTVAIHEAGRGREAYERVLDEDLGTDPMGTAAALYERCGLPFEGAVRRWLERWARDWQARRVPWRELLEPGAASAVEDVLGREELAGWWAPDAKVSGIGYGWR